MRNRIRACAWLLCACATLASAPPASAQDKDAVTESARRRFQEGVRAFDHGRFEEARAAFLQAYALKHHPAVLLNLAQSELRCQRLQDAARHFAAFLRESTSASAAERADAEKGLANARSKLGRVQAMVDVKGATVSIDGDAIGDSPLPEAIDVTPGAHVIEARLGARTASANLTAQIGRTTSVSLVLDTGTATSAPPADATPLLPPASSPGAPVTAPGKATPDDAPAPPRSLTTAAGAETTSPATGFFDWVARSPFAWASLAVTAAGLGTAGVAAYFAHRANDNVTSVDDQIQAKAQEYGYGSKVCGPPVQAGFESACGVLQDNISKRDTDVTIAVVGLAAAGAGVLATVTGYLVSSGSSSAPASQTAVVVVPRVDGHGATFALSGSF